METNQGGAEMYGDQPTTDRGTDRTEPKEREREVPVRTRSEPNGITGIVRAMNAPIRVQEIGLDVFATKLVSETFEAIVGATAKQAETYGAILDDLAKPLEQLAAERVSDAQVFAFLAEHYPDHMGGTVVRWDFAFEDTLAADEITAKTASQKLREVVESLRRELPQLAHGARYGLPDPAENARGFEFLVNGKDDQISGKIRRAIAEKLAERLRAKLMLLARTGVPRVVVSGGEIASKLLFKVSATEAERREAARLQSDALGTNVRGSRDGWTHAAASVAHSRISVTPVNEETFDPSVMDGSIVGELRLEFITENFPALAAQA